MKCKLQMKTNKNERGIGGEGGFEFGLTEMCVLLLPGRLTSFNSEDSSERINKKLQIKIRVKCCNKN